MSIERNMLCIKMWRKSLLSSILSALSLLSCRGISSDDLLAGKFVGKDTTPVDLLAPTDKSTSSKSPKFVWTKRTGASGYLLEVSTSSSFGTPVLAKTVNEGTYTLSNADLKDIAELDALSYSWRVTAIYPDQRVISKSAIFHVLDDLIVYVNIGSTSSEQVGNKGTPFKSIQAAIESANTRRNGVSTTALDVFVAAGTYAEEVNLRPGISIRGGYEAVGWTRNIAAYATTITAPTDFAIRGGSAITVAYANTTVVEGFSITGGSVGVTYGINLVQASPTIRQNTIQGGAGSNTYAIYCSTGSQPIVTNNTILGGTSGSSTFSYGIFSNSTSPSISGNTITGGNASGANYGIYNNISASPSISNNIITGGNGSGSNYGIHNNSSSPSIWNNTINGGASGSVKAISIFSGTPNIRNNILFTSGGTTRNCLDELNGSSDPSFFENNNLFDCPTALYRDENATTVTNMSTSVSTGAGTNTLAFFGNVNINNAGNQLFTDIDGSDNNMLTMSDNDWHLTTNAAICDVRGGGLTISGITTDKDGVTRTIGTIAGCTPANTGATNWSIGAYESN